MQNDAKNVNTIQDLAVVMFREFARIHEQFSEVNIRLGNLESSVSELKTDVGVLKTDVDSLKAGQERLEKKIEDEIENLALITKHGFDEMTGEFREVHDELDQVKNHVMGIERRVTKLEEARSR